MTETVNATDDVPAADAVVGAHPAPAPAPTDARTTAEIVYDVVTALALLVGGFVVPVAGWVAGVVMLWNGPRWSNGWRWAGTLAWPVVIALGIGSLAVPGRVAFLTVGALAGPALVVLSVLLSRAARR